MEGSPLIRAIVALAVLLFLLVPLHSFTRPFSTVGAATVTPVQETSAHLKIVSTKKPFSFVVAHLGKTIWQGKSTDESIQTNMVLPIPDEGIDLLLKIMYSNDETAAAKLVVTHGDYEPIERIAWGKGHINEVLTFP